MNLFVFQRSSASANRQALRWMFVLIMVGLYGCAGTPRAVEVPEVRISTLSLIEATADSQRFQVGLSVHNTNAVAIPIEALSFSMRLGGGGLLTGRTTEPFTLEPGAEQTVAVEVDSDLVSSLSRLIGLLQGPSDAISYDLDGLVRLSRGLNRTLPFNYRGQVPLALPAGQR